MSASLEALPMLLVRQLESNSARADTGALLRRQGAFEGSFGMGASVCGGRLRVYVSAAQGAPKTRELHAARSEPVLRGPTFRCFGPRSPLAGGTRHCSDRRRWCRRRTKSCCDSPWADLADRCADATLTADGFPQRAAEGWDGARWNARPSKISRVVGSRRCRIRAADTESSER